MAELVPNGEYMKQITHVKARLALDKNFNVYTISEDLFCKAEAQKLISHEVHSFTYIICSHGADA